jgi:gliding motility-associated-like protein
MRLLLKRKIIFAKIGAFLLALTTIVLHGADFYVSKTGVDTNPGTLASPFLTIGKAISTAAAGDNVYVGTGAYSESVVITKSLKFFVDSCQVNKLIMYNSTAVLTLDGWNSLKSFNVFDSLVLTRGIVKVENTLSAFRALKSCGIGGGNATSFVDGRLHIGKETGIMDITFPVGVSNSYRPTRITFTKSNGDLTYYFAEVKQGAALSPGNLPSGIRNYSRVNYYNLGTVPKNAANSNSFVLDINYDSVQMDDRVYDGPNLRVIGYEGSSAWGNYGGTGSAVRKGKITTVSMAKLGLFALANAYQQLTATQRKSGVNTLGSDSAYAKWRINLGRCSNDSIRFLDQSKSIGSAIQSYSWNFGDPASFINTSTKRNPVFKFSGAGTYRVSMVMMNNDGYLDSWVEDITIFQSPIIVRTARELCIGETTTFTDNSLAPKATDISKWYWNMGDGGTPAPPPTIYTTKTVTHTYANPGPYKVFHYVTSKDNCETRDTFTYFVHNKPSVDFTTEDKCIGQTNAFTDNTTVDVPDKIRSRIWYMGDGQVLTGTTAADYKIITKKYGAPGLYQVKILVFSDFQGLRGYCRDSLTKPVRIYDNPKIKYEQSHTCFEETTTFTDKTTVDPADFAKSYSWNFGDLTFDTTMYGASHDYLAAGAYKTRLTVITNALCSSSDTMTVYVHPKPKADFTTKEKCFGDSTEFIHLPTAGIPDTRMTYNWRVDNLYVYFNKDIKHKFAAPGTYTAKMYATTNQFCKDSIEKTVRSFYMPRVYFDLDQTITPNDSIQCLKYNNYYFNKIVDIDPNDTLFNSAWNFGDGTTEMPATSINHNFDSVKVYTVKLYGVSIHGCADSMVRQYETKPSPVAKFYFEGDCVPDSILFNDTSSISVLPIVKRTWVFEGTEYSSLPLPNKYQYTTAGPHDVSYVITNDVGCSDTMLKSISFTEKPTLSINFSGTMPLCLGDSINVSISGADTITWLHDGSTQAVRNFYGKGWYKIAGKTGICTALDSIFVQAYPPSKINAYNDTTIYRGTTAKLWTDGVKDFKWSPNKWINSDTLKVITARPLDTMVYKVYTKDANGCESEDSVKVKVIDPPLVRIPNLITPNSDGENEFWDLSELKDYWLYDITLSDRQGKRIFYTQNYQNDWQALDTDGGQLPVGIYFYHMKNRNTGEEYRGFIQVIR